MEALLQSLAAKYGFDVAKKLLGLDKQSGNPKFTFGMPFTNNKVSINPMKMIGNQVFKSAISGGKMSMGLPLLAAGLGLAYMRNPLREGSMNYNPELQGQINYLSGMDGMIGKDPNSYALKYGPDSVLRGKNVVSMFVNNDYAKNLQDYIDKMEARKTKGYNTIGIGPFKTKTTNFTEGQQELLDKAKRELENLTTDEFDKVDEFMSAQTPTQTGPTYTGMGSIGSGGNGGGSGSSKSSPSKSSPSKSSPSKSSSYSSSRGSNFGGRFHNAKGGIASL